MESRSLASQGRQVSRIEIQQGDLYPQHYDQRKELGRGKFGVVYHVKVILGDVTLVITHLQDRLTDRCYAAKHIRIQKPEQKEKVRTLMKARGNYFVGEQND